MENKTFLNVLIFGQEQCYASSSLLGNFRKVFNGFCNLFISTTMK